MTIHLSPHFKKSFLHTCHEKTANRKKVEEARVEAAKAGLGSKISPASAAMAAGATTGAISTAIEGASTHLMDLREARSGKMKRSYKNLLKTLKPGDIIYSGYGSQDSGALRLGKRDLPIRTSHGVQALMGSQNYHGMIYLGGGRIAQAEGPDSPLSIRNLKSEAKRQRLKVYRPTGASAKEVQDAIDYAKKSRGTRYKSAPEIGKMVAHRTLNPMGGPRTCRKEKGGIVCNTLVNKAYPNQMTQAYAGHNELRRTRGMEFVGGIDKLKPSRKDAFISKAVSPAIRSARFAIPAAAVAGVGTAAYRGLRGKKEEAR